MSVKSVRTYENKTWTQVEPKFQKWDDNLYFQEP
jgi:hypothetical protein